MFERVDPPCLKCARKLIAMPDPSPPQLTQERNHRGVNLDALNSGLWVLGHLEPSSTAACVAAMNSSIRALAVSALDTSRWW